MPSLKPSDGAESPSPGSGAYTLAEMLSQPKCWSDCLHRLESGATIRQIEQRFSSQKEWVFVGCGSSYYIALAAAASWTAITGGRARAVPASELLVYPEVAFNGATEFVPVLISRSGLTSEVLRVAQLLNEKRIPNIAISCAPGQKLESIASISIVLPEADEQSTVMTRSFTSMLLGLQYLAARMAKKDDLIAAFEAVPALAGKILQDLPGRVREFIGHNSFSDYVCLGQGPFYGLSCESALKVMEMSQTYAQSFHTLEFRHGPKSVVGENVLITFLLSGAGYDAELEVLEEMKDLGAKTLVVANHISRRARSAADLAIELDYNLPELARLTSFIIPGQLTGFHNALRKGLDPDRPVNLSRVVLLAD